MQIKPFKGYRFNETVVKDPNLCIAPPYDVIDTDQQQTLYQQSTYNIVRAIRPAKDPANDPYTAAKNYLEEMIKTSALKQDPKPAIYAYVQHFTIQSQTYTRSGFIALGKLTEFGDAVLPHEKTLSGPKSDRLKLMTATRAQFGQIFMLYDDPEKVADSIIDKLIKPYNKTASESSNSAQLPSAINDPPENRTAAAPTQTLENKPVIDHIDPLGTTHRLYLLTDTAQIEAITKMMADKKTVIADGHHRYETALNYSRQSDNPQAQFRMMTFVNMRNPGLVVLPTHRLVSNLNQFLLPEMLANMQKHFQISEFRFEEDPQTIDNKDIKPSTVKSQKTSRDKAGELMFDKMEKSAKSNVNIIGFYAGTGAFYTAELTDNQIMKKRLKNQTDHSRKLDVSVLHSLILEDILGIGDKQLSSQSNIKYLKDSSQAKQYALEQVDSGKSNIVFFMNATPIDQVRNVAMSGEKMPQKSTFFYPKVFTGLVINILDR